MGPQLYQYSIDLQKKGTKWLYFQILSPHDKEIQNEILNNLKPVPGAFQVGRHSSIYIYRPYYHKINLIYIIFLKSAVKKLNETVGKRFNIEIKQTWEKYLSIFKEPEENNPLLSDPMADVYDSYFNIIKV